MDKIILKTEQELEIMQEGGKIVGMILNRLTQEARPGMQTQKLEELTTRLLGQQGVVGSFKGYQGYPYNTVICLNDEVVHGMPSTQKLQVDDYLTIDLGVFHRGFHTDTATTIRVGKDMDEFLRVGQKALEYGISETVVGHRIGDVAAAIQNHIEANGFSVIRAFVGHGIGRQLHEPPEVPGFGSPKSGIVLKHGMVIAVEVMYAQGGYEVKILDDGWTAVTLDGSRSAMFEHTVAITKEGPIVLTNRDSSV